jgi:hypothetical protein
MNTVFVFVVIFLGLIAVVTASWVWLKWNQRFPSNSTSHPTLASDDRLYLENLMQSVGNLLLDTDREAYVTARNEAYDFESRRQGETVSWQRDQLHSLRRKYPTVSDFNVIGISHLYRHGLRTAKTAELIENYCDIAKFLALVKTRSGTTE